MGDRRYSFPTVLTIVLVDFEIPELKESEKFILHVMLKDDENKIFSEKMSFLLIDLTKFAAEINFERLTDEIQKWCYVIKNMWRMKDGDIPAEETIFRELFENCKLSKLNTMEKQEYEKSVLEYEDVRDAMEYHHRMGKAEGFNEGFEKGMEKGMDFLIRTVKKLVSMGLSVKDIAEATGLPVEEVIRLNDK